MIIKNILHNKFYVLIIFLTCTFFIYFNTFYVGLLSDDYGYFIGVANDGWNSLLNNFNDPFFLPLSHFIQLIIYKIFGQNLYVFHGVQIFFHVLIGWQLYLILKEINDQKIIFAFLTGLIFLILPYQTETIIWLASKGYVFCLFFTCLSIKYYLKGHYNSSYLFIILAIFCKEMGYIIPILLFIIELYRGQFSLFKKKIIPFSLILTSCITIRFIVLNSLIGGYGGATHLNFNLITVIKTIFAYLIKYATFYRYSNSILIAILVFTALIIISIPYIKTLNNKKSINKIILILALFITSILPVINLEITSLFSIQSDRYGYFSTVIFAIFLSYIICCWKTPKILMLSILTITVFSTLTYLDTKKWVAASEICNQYLNELIKQDLENKNVILVNIPDNYKGVYVLRHGIDEFLELNNIKGKISVINYQSFSSLNSGIEIYNSKLKNISCNVIKTDSLILNQFLLSPWEYDSILYYNSNSFQPLNSEKNYFWESI